MPRVVNAGVGQNEERFFSDFGQVFQTHAGLVYGDLTVLLALFIEI